MPINESRWVSRATLIKLLGEEGARRVIEVFGGTRIFLPAPDAPSFARLTEKLGEEIARKLCAEFGDCRISLPRRLVPFRRKDHDATPRDGHSPEIARRLDCSERYVYVVLARQ